MIISARIDATTARNGPRSYPKHPRWPSSSSIIELADLTKSGKTHWCRGTARSRRARLVPSLAAGGGARPDCSNEVPGGRISYLHPPHCCADELLEELVSAPGPVPSPHAARPRARPTLGLGHENCQTGEETVITGRAHAGEAHTLAERPSEFTSCMVSSEISP